MRELNISKDIYGNYNQTQIEGYKQGYEQYLNESIDPRTKLTKEKFEGQN
jgi:hypothetical protein